VDGSAAAFGWTREFIYIISPARAITRVSAPSQGRQPLARRSARRQDVRRAFPSAST